MFPRPQACAVGKFQRGNFFASFHFDAGNRQKSFLAAADQEFFAVEVNLTLLEIWLVVCRGHRCQARVPVLSRHRLAEKLANRAAKYGIGAGPGSKSAHAVVNGLRGELPVDAAVFFF